MNSDLLQYTATRNKNREVFLLNYENEFAAFEDIDARLQKLVWFIGTHRTINGPYQTSLIPFILITILQGRNAFESLSRFQSPEAWLIFRPGLEATLFMGKFVDDPENATIWKDRYNNLKKYKKTFQGKGLISDSFPRAKKYQEVMKFINDRFMHSNYDYYVKDLILQSIGGGEKFIGKEFFDKNSDFHEANLISFLHLTWLVGQSIGQMFCKQYGQNSVLEIDAETITNIWGSRAIELSSKGSEYKEILLKLGLWELPKAKTRN